MKCEGSINGVPTTRSAKEAGPMAKREKICHKPSSSSSPIGQKGPNCLEIPQDIWSNVYARLDILDSIMFNCVCKEFRSISTNQVPRLSNVVVLNTPTIELSQDHLELVSFNNSNINKYKISLPETIVNHIKSNIEWSCIGSSFGYLIFYCQEYLHKILLWNPVSKREIFDDLPQMYEAKTIRNAILSIKPTITNNKYSTTGRDFFVICSTYEDDDIYICRQGDVFWTHISRIGLSIENLVCHNNRLYVTTLKRRRRIFCIDISDLKDISRFEFLVDFIHTDCQNLNLAKSSKGDELILIQYIRNNGVETRKLNEEKMEWIPTSLVDEYCLIMWTIFFYRRLTICLSRERHPQLISQLSKQEDLEGDVCHQQSDDNSNVYVMSYFRPRLFSHWLVPNPC